MSAVPPPSRKEDQYLRWIACLNILKGLLLTALAIGLLGFLHKDVDVIVGNWISLLGLNMENRHIVALLARLDMVTDRELSQWSGLTFLFAGLFFTEGTGLLLKQQWAKYLTVIVTASFIPIEVIESLKHFGVVKVALLVINIGVVWFLLVLLRREKQRTRRYEEIADSRAREAGVECGSI